MSMEPDPIEFPLPPPAPVLPVTPPPTTKYFVYKVGLPGGALHTFDAPISLDDINCKMSKIYGAGIYKIETVESKTVINKNQITIQKNNKKCPIKGHCL